RVLPVIAFLVESLVDEGVFPQCFECDLPQIARGDNPVSVDLGPRQRDCPPCRPPAGALWRGHQLLSLASTISPAMAAAATIAGLMRSVRPFGDPCLPIKFLLDELPQTCLSVSLSGFMARHMEHPAPRHSNPAA